MTKDKAKKMNKAQAQKGGVFVIRDTVKEIGDNLTAFNGDNYLVTAFNGDNYEAQVTPTGDLAIFELMPDVGNANDGKPVARLRHIIAEGTWRDVIVK